MRTKLILVRRLHETFHQPFRRVVQAPEDVAEAASTQGKVPLVLSPSQPHLASQQAATGTPPRPQAAGRKIVVSDSEGEEEDPEQLAEW